MKKKYKVIFADLDGTLIETLSGETFPKGIWDMKIRGCLIMNVNIREPI